MLLDYDLALFYVMWSRWDDLFTLMLRTKDDMLRKRIQLFLQAYYYASRENDILKTHDQLLGYVDHALENKIT